MIGSLWMLGLLACNADYELNTSEADDANLSLGTRLTGSYQLLGDVLTRFSDHCTNTVTQTSTVPKPEIQVLWKAPPAGSGCVVFRASVLAQPEVWAMDKGRLSLKLCEREVAEHKSDSTEEVNKELSLSDHRRYCRVIIGQ